MNQPDERRTSGSPEDNRYDPTVAKTERRSVEEVREQIGQMTTAGAKGHLEEHFLVSRHGKTGVAIVPLDWYRRAREALGDPTDA